MTRNYSVCGSHPHLVLCSADKDKISRLITKLEYKGIDFAIFREPDMDNEMTAIATIPINGNDRKIFKGFKLLGKEKV